MTKMSLPSIKWQPLLRPLIGLVILAIFSHSGYLIWQIGKAEADPAHLAEERAKLDNQKLKFDREAIEDITAPPALSGAGRDPFSP